MHGAVAFDFFSTTATATVPAAPHHDSLSHSCTCKILWLLRQSFHFHFAFIALFFYRQMCERQKPLSYICLHFLISRFGLTRALTHSCTRAQYVFMFYHTHQKTVLFVVWLGGAACSNLLNKLKASYSRVERLIRLLESHRTHATTLDEHKSDEHIAR